MRTEMTMKTEAAKHGLVIIRFVPSFHSFKSCILLSPPAPVLPLVFVFTVLLNVKLNWLNWTRNLNQLFFLFAAASYHRSTNPCQLWTPFASTKVTPKQHLSVSTSLCTMRVSCTVQSRCIHTKVICVSNCTGRHLPVFCCSGFFSSAFAHYPIVHLPHLSNPHASVSSSTSSFSVQFSYLLVWVIFHWSSLSLSVGWGWVCWQINVLQVHGRILLGTSQSEQPIKSVRASKK